MNKYELVVILEPGLKEEEQKEMMAKLGKVVTDSKGTIVKKEVWGKKPLAYPIKKFSEGIYLRIEFDFPPEKTNEWEAKLKLEEKIIRYLLVKLLE